MKNKNKIYKVKSIFIRMLFSSFFVYRVIVERLRTNGDVSPRMFDTVTIYFSDIDGFGDFAARSSPYEVIVFLNNVYSTFDNILRNFDVYKVETINDSYVVSRHFGL